MNCLTKESMEFLKNVKHNNSKTWYEDHKDDYIKLVVDPMKEMVLALQDDMYEIDSSFVIEPFVGRTISRLHRDTRFSKDKSLYKDRVWITFKKRFEDNIDYPAYFIEVSPYSYRYGMGFFKASASSMELYREKIEENEMTFLKIINEIEVKKRFDIEGEMYKKNRYEGKYTEIAKWYNRKNIYVAYNSSNIEELYGSELISCIKKDFHALSELYNFLKKSLEKK